MPVNTQVESTKVNRVLESGTGKPIVRRRVPPPPISPTLEGILSSQPIASTSKSPERSSATNRRPKLAIRTIPPLTESNDGSTARALTPKRSETVKSFQNSFRDREGDQAQTGELVPDASLREGKENVSAANASRNRRDSKIAAKAREIRAWMMGKSGSDIHQYPIYSNHEQDKRQTSYATRTRQTLGEFFRSRRRDDSRVDRGPKPGQTYEIVNRRVVESSPEKTVEISTWREQATKQVNDDEERLSVYYISADEYLLEGDYTNEAGPKVEWRMEGSVLSPEDKQASHTGSVSLPHSGEQAEVVPSQVEQAQRPQPPQKLESKASKDGTISPSTSEKDQDVEKHLSNSRNRRPNRGGSGSRQSATRRHGRYKESTPIERNLPKSSFHATQSGSTISSIKSDTTLEFEAILASCEPSLLHISPILKRLGIRRLEHLKAVARLTPRTRDREVKEDALRLGITVMEWAILLDKIFTL